MPVQLPSETKSCMGFYSKKERRCGNCSRRDECRDETNKTKKLPCFGKFKSLEHQCKICQHAKGCRDETKRLLVAKMVKPIPSDVVEETLQAAALWLRANPNMWLMKELDGRRVYRNNGNDVFVMGDVLRGVVEGTARIQDSMKVCQVIPVVKSNQVDDDGITCDMEAIMKELRKAGAPGTNPQDEDDELRKRAKAMVAKMPVPEFPYDIVAKTIDWKLQEEERIFHQLKHETGKPVAHSDDRFDCYEEPEDDEGVEEMVCINNTGMENGFDLGITYFVEESIEKNMLVATDKFGKKVLVMEERFRKPENVNTKA